MVPGGAWSRGMHGPRRGAWSWGVCMIPGVHGPLGCLLPGGACSLGGAWFGGTWQRPPTTTAAGGTHPTGMHSCLGIAFV